MDRADGQSRNRVLLAMHEAGVTFPELHHLNRQEVMVDRDTLLITTPRGVVRVTDRLAVEAHKHWTVARLSDGAPAYFTTNRSYRLHPDMLRTYCRLERQKRARLAGKPERARVRVGGETLELLRRVEVDGIIRLWCRAVGSSASFPHNTEASPTEDTEEYRRA